jgi:hypothetical protein
MVFCFVQKFFFRTTPVGIFIFFVAQSEFFFQNLTLSYMTKTLNQIIFFSSTKIRIFFSATLGIRIFFLEKYHNPFSRSQNRARKQMSFSRIAKIEQKNQRALVG